MGRTIKFRFDKSEMTTRIKKYSIHMCLLSVFCNLFIFVCMGFNAISKVGSFLRIYLGAITSAFLRSLQATDSFSTWSIHYQDMRPGGKFICLLCIFDSKKGP